MLVGVDVFTLLSASAAAVDQQRVEELHAQLVELERAENQIVVVGLVEPAYVRALRYRAPSRYSVFRLDSGATDVVYVPERVFLRESDPLAVYAQLGGNGWTFTELTVARLPDSPKSFGVTEVALVLGVGGAMPLFDNRYNDEGLGYFLPIPAASPILGGEIDIGTRGVGVLFSADVSPTLVYAHEENGCCFGIARATLAFRVGNLQSLVVGPYVEAGLIMVGAGLRVAKTYELRRSGQLHGWEARVGMLAPDAVEVRLLYRRAHRYSWTDAIDAQ